MPLIVVLKGRYTTVTNCKIFLNQLILWYDENPVWFGFGFDYVEFQSGLLVKKDVQSLDDKTYALGGLYYLTQQPIACNP